MTCVGELECYVRASSEEEARKKLIATYAKLGGDGIDPPTIVVVFPEMEDEEVAPLGDLWSEEDELVFKRDRLQLEYNQWLRDNVPSDHRDMCADDVMATINNEDGFSITKGQYAWLEDFCKRWDNVTKGGNAS